MKKLVWAGCMGLLCSGVQAAEFQSLSDAELSQVQGQALLNFTKDSYVYTNASNEKLNFFKLGLNAEMELNSNIKSLQLGCGGDNGAGNCDISIANLALSGLPDSYAADGSPLYSNSRASTSAKITNPFVEFAVKNSDKASTREVVGFRLGAQEILGLLSAGTENTQDPSDGIQSFSGYMKMAQTNGDVRTKQAVFGDSTNEQIQGYITALGQDRTFTSNSGHKDNKGVTVPSITVGFVMPETIVSGNRLKNAVVSGISAKIDKIPLAAGSGVAGVNDDVFKDDQLFVEFAAIAGIAKSAKFQMANGSVIKNLNMDITFTQALSMVHNIPLTGTGGYLSMQKEAVKWAGTDAADIAQRGWWMSFKDPVQLGYLQAQNEVDISAVLPQVAQLVTEYLTTEANRIDVGFWEAIGSVLTVPISKKLEIDLNSYTAPGTGSPATIALTSQILKNQKVASNCYGGMKFC